MLRTQAVILLVVAGSMLELQAQVTPQIQKYRNDQKGNIQFRRQGIMDGNLIRTIFINNGEVGQWPFQPSGEWPKGSGQTYLDGVCVLVASEVRAPGNNQIIHPLLTSYREWMDEDPVTGEIWGLEPVPGYLSPASQKPAISADPESWPKTWPQALDLPPVWNGFWYGYFGRGITNSDFETFFVMDDSKDGEWKRAPYSFVPIASDPSHGGIGLRVEVRGFQWSHVLAEDIIFWHYDIVNISDRDYDTTVFGFYTDPGVGGTNDSQDDNASYDTKLDLAYAFDDDGYGAPIRWKTGYYGYAYLESPGNALNSIDDDEDGMVDERRDDGIDNDGDWVPFTDLNNNGQWDAAGNEPLNDDVGRDGLGPWDPGYFGPDEGEGNGVPDDGEPNFDKTDKDESDQIGLTSLSIYRLGDGGVGGGWPKDDESMWLKMNYQNFDTSLQRSNISMVFASGPFPLKQGRRERFSMALVFGSNLDDIIFNKETVQQIYNANYNFSRPPLKPTLTAVPDDGKVYLYWNRVAEESRDPFLGYEQGNSQLGYKKDFEGYLLYRSTEAEFADVKVITDSKGESKYWKPIAQFDLVNGIKGPDPVGINGAHFWRGDDTGLQHSYIDTDVKNGVRYYYALVSYDQGDPAFGTTGLQPTECTKIISEDFSGNIKFIDINCAVVTPNAPAAGYVPPEIDGDLQTVSEGVGTGSLNVNILNPGSIRQGVTYRVVFTAEGTLPGYRTASYDVVRLEGSRADTLVQNVGAAEFGVGKFSPPFDGMTVSVFNDTLISVIPSSMGWVVGTSNMRLSVVRDTTSRAAPWPCDYEIRFADTPQDTTYFNTPPLYPRMIVNFTVTNTTTGKRARIVVRDSDQSLSFTPGDEILIIEFAGAETFANFRIAWIVRYYPPAGQPAIAPVSGDRFVFRTRKQFQTGDAFTFSTKSASVDNDLARSKLQEILVVPNPYVSGASWERRFLNQTGRGERKIDFVNLPARCTVRIYSIAGALIKTLHKDSSPSDGALSWNLVSEDGMDIAYGLYIYHVEAPDIGEHIGKFAVIK
jgi:hypothetical protein